MLKNPPVHQRNWGAQAEQMRAAVGELMVLVGGNTTMTQHLSR